MKREEFDDAEISKYINYKKYINYIGGFMMLSNIYDGVNLWNCQVNGFNLATNEKNSLTSFSPSS